jgi:ArsR family transcriptional regulator
MNDFHAIAKAMADPQRFQIFEMVAAEVEMPCGDIAARCPVSQATVSHHLKVLQDVGLFSVRR